MNVGVTGADGFVGRALIPRLVGAGHRVTAGVLPATPTGWRPPDGVEVVSFEITDDASVRGLVEGKPDAIIHLAAMASGGDARRDPGRAWEINAVGTARLAEHLGRLRLEGRADPLLLVVSTAEVYGVGRGTAHVESDPLEPVSPYAASKLAAEVAALEVWRRTGLRVVIARAFPHSGPGQDDRFVLPAFARRLALAKRAGAPAVNVGNLDVVREFMHVSDVVEAYLGLLAEGRAGQVYNVASGRGVPLADVFRMVADETGHRVVPETDPALVRRADIPHLVGDAARLRAATGWSPKVSLEQLVKEVVDAQAH